MSNILLAKSLKAEVAMPAYKIAKHGSIEGSVALAYIGTDKLLGITTDIPAAIGERCDVILSGVAEVLYGGAVTRGDLLTNDGSGNAVTAAPAAGANVRVIGVALVSGALGDVGQCMISQAMLQG